MTEALSLDGVTMYVSHTAADGVVGRETRILFRQQGARVTGEYSGGRVRRGRLVGALCGGRLTFRFAQAEASGDVHAGRSVCQVARSSDGRLRIEERFRWTTRPGSGTNVFEEVEESG